MTMGAAVLLFCSAGLFAADFTGKWTGTVQVDNKTYSVLLTLRQSGSELVGVLTDDKDHDFALSNGKVTADRVMFDIEASKERIHFDLSGSGDQVTGQATSKRGDREQTAKISFTRQGAAPSGSGIGGRWAGLIELNDKGEERRFQFGLRLVQKGSEITGLIVSEDGKEHTISGGSIDGDRLTFGITTDNEQVRFDLRLAGDILSGTAVARRGDRDEPVKVTAVRRAE